MFFIKLEHANFFLLTHKVGNNYFDSTFRDQQTIQTQADSLKNEMPGPYVSEFLKYNPYPKGINPFNLKSTAGSALFALRARKILRKNTVNFRCRNFDPISIENLTRALGSHRGKYFLFTRHPASFFKSATQYHLRGGEKWSTTVKYSYLGGLTLTEALRREENSDERLIISMKHFELRWGLLSRMIQNYNYLSSINAEIIQVKVEDLFRSRSSEFWKGLAREITVGDFQCTPEFLKRNSPAFLNNLPIHATGIFKESPFEGYGSTAKDFYENYFIEIQNFFYRDQSK